MFVPNGCMAPMEQERIYYRAGEPRKCVGKGWGAEGRWSNGQQRCCKEQDVRKQHRERKQRQQKSVACFLKPPGQKKVCCHAIKENFKSREVSAHQPEAAGTVPFAGEHGPIFSLHSSHPTVAHSPSQTAVGMPPILQSRQKDLVEKSLVWVFLRYWRHFSSQLSAKWAAKPPSSGSKTSARLFIAVVILYSDTFGQAYYLWS